MDALHAEDVPDQNGELGSIRKRRLMREGKMDIKLVPVLSTGSRMGSKLRRCISSQNTRKRDLALRCCWIHQIHVWNHGMWGLRDKILRSLRARERSIQGRVPTRRFYTASAGQKCKTVKAYPRHAIWNSFNLFLLVSDWLVFRLLWKASSSETKGRMPGYSIFEG